MVPTPSPSRLPTPGTNTILDCAPLSCHVRCYFLFLQASSPSLMHLDLGAAVCFPALGTTCGNGYGMAVCPALGLLVTSDDEEDTLSVFTLPSSVCSTTGGAASGPALVCTLGGASSPAPMHAVRVQRPRKQRLFWLDGLHWPRHLPPPPPCRRRSRRGARYRRGRPSARGVRGGTRHHFGTSGRGGQGLPGGRQRVEKKR